MPPTPKQQELLDGFVWDQKNLVAEYSFGGTAVYLDAFPVTEGHMLFVPLDQKNIHIAFNKALAIAQQKVADQEWDGFNIGINHGEAAGQTIKWPHIHVIPRHAGDCTNPAGGVRGVIPKNQNWKTAAKYKKIRIIAKS